MAKRNMSKKDYEALADLIVFRMNQGWESEAMRLYDKALARGVDFSKLEQAIFEARYGKE